MWVAQSSSHGERKNKVQATTIKPLGSPLNLSLSFEEHPEIMNPTSVVEAERMFQQEINAAIENAQANGLDGGHVAYNLRSTASKVSKQWKAELARRQAERIAQMNAQAAAQH
jgi:hypothetical protein